MWPEDELYEQWKHAGAEERPELEAQILMAAKRHAEVVVWLGLYERNFDLINEIGEDAVQGLPKFREDSLYSTWVHRIALNKVFEEYRRRTRERKALGNPVPLLDIEQDERFGTEPPDTLLAIDLGRLLEKLPEDERECLSLWLEGRPAREIGEIERLAEDNIEAKLRRSFVKLRKMLPAAAEN